MCSFLFQRFAKGFLRGLSLCIALIAPVAYPGAQESAQESAKEFNLPGNVQLSVPESYVPIYPKIGKRLKVHSTLGSHSFTIGSPENASGLGFIRLVSSSKSKQSPGAVGDLEAYVVHSENYSIGEEARISLDLDEQPPSLEYTNTMTSHCSAEGSSESQCDLDQHTLYPGEENKTTIQSHPHLKEQSSTLASGKAVVRRLTYVNIKKSQINLKNPTVHFDGQQCTMGVPSDTSNCQHLSALIFRFIPLPGQGQAELAFHIITPAKAASSEDALRSAIPLLSEQADTDWMRTLGFLFSYRDDYPIYDQLPLYGVPDDDLYGIILDMAKREQKVWISGTCSGTMYCGELDFYDKQLQAAGPFMAYNALQADMHPSMAKMEAEIVRMTLAMHGGSKLQKVREQDGCILDEGCGYVTQGGTDSNMAAMRAFYKVAKNRGHEKVVIVAPDTIHPSFDKAADYYGFELRKARTDPSTKQVIIDEVRRLIDEDINVAGIAASAPGYAFGVYDDISELNNLVEEYNAQGRKIELHVDSCMGGFIYPFAVTMAESLNKIACEEQRDRMGEDFREEDHCHSMTFPGPLFSYPAVSSVSADLHKYGYTVKGSSVILFRSEELLNAQQFSQPEWDGGGMVNHGSFGSRSGGQLAAPYFTMLSLGDEGYSKRAWKILLTAHRFQNIVRGHDRLKVIGNSAMCFAFVAKDPGDFNIFHISDLMRHRSGWRFNATQHPNALHFCVTVPQTWAAETDHKSGPTEHALYIKAGLSKQLYLELDRTLSQATELFEADLAWALSQVDKFKGQPALTGSMYGLGASGISIENPALKEAILRVGRMLMLKTPDRGLGSLLLSGKHQVGEILKNILEIPAY